MLDEHIAWNDHIHAIEKKLAKNIGLLYRARQFLDKESLKTIYFSYIHSYLNYANIAWASTYFTKLKTIHYQQKHAARIIFDEDILTHSRPLLRSLNALNIYQINLYQHANFMYKFKKNQSPKIINMAFEKLPINILPSFQKLTLNTKNILWLVQNIQFLWEIQSHSIFLRKVRTKLLESNNERKFLKIAYHLRVSPWTRSRS